MSSPFDSQIASPALSPSTDEFDGGAFTDENGNVLPMVALAPISAAGHSGIASDLLQVVPVSSVTDKRQPPLVLCPGGEKIPVMALVGLDSSGNPTAFSAPSAVVVSGKFQSAERTATGSSESIAHGLGVVPSLVLVSLYNTNGVALPFSILEGTHTSTNVLVTVTANLKYKVIAFA